MPAQWWKQCFHGMLAWVYRLTVSAPGSSWDGFFFDLVIQYNFLLYFDHFSKFDFFLWCYLACNFTDHEHVWTQMWIFFPPPRSLLFLFWMNVTVAHQALYIFTVLPFLCPSNMWTILSTLPHDRSFLSVLFVSEKLCLFWKKKKSFLFLDTVPFECVRTGFAVCTSMSFDQP